MQSKAVVATVKFGHKEIEGLMLPDGSFALSVTQVASIFQFDSNQASRTLKPLLGKDFQFDTTVSELNPKKVNIVTLLQFEQIIRKLDRQGNKAAQEFVDDSVGLNLVQAFSDAFKIKFEAKERKAWAEFRQDHRETFHFRFTCWLKLDKPQRRDYGTQVDKLKLFAKCPLKPIEQYDSKELKQLNDAYIVYDAMRRKGFSHTEALESL